MAKVVCPLAAAHVVALVSALESVESGCLNVWTPDVVVVVGRDTFMAVKLIKQRRRCQRTAVVVVDV